MRRYWVIVLSLLMLLVAPDAMAAAQINGSGASTILSDFNGEATNWYQSLKSIAEGIFYVLFGIDFVIPQGFRCLLLCLLRIPSDPRYTTRSPMWFSGGQPCTHVVFLLPWWHSPCPLLRHPPLLVVP